MIGNSGGKPSNPGFSYYLRTGRIRVSARRASEVETKFNPWHDPEDGRFTTAGNGGYSGGANAAQAATRMAKPPTQADLNRAAQDRAQAESMTDAERGRIERERAKNDPKNFARHVVKPGENLTKISQTRHDLSPAELASFNDISPSGILRAGQVLKVPTQAWVDSQNARLERFDRELFYLRRHGLPPIPRTVEEAVRTPHLLLSDLPTIDEQVAEDAKTFFGNGYTFQGDPVDRIPSRAWGKLQFNTRAKRSKTEQLRAGGQDRRKTDHGGHIIASEFNGPPEWFNHFAQDAKFNSGAYRKLEIGWGKLGRAGHEIYVDITVHRKSPSKRPYSLNVKWTVDGQFFEKDYPNEAGSK